MDTLIPMVLPWCLVGLSATILLALVRLAMGPTVVDRMLAFDLIAVSGVGIIAVVSVMLATTAYLELILIYSLLGFVGTVALTTYLQRTRERGRGERGGRRRDE